MGDAYSEYPDAKGTTKGGDEFELWITDDEDEELHQYSVRLASLGYSITFRTDTADTASALFAAFKHVTEIEAD